MLSFLRIVLFVIVAVALAISTHSLKPFLILIEALFFFNLLIFVHELGHFLAARWRGLVVDRFGIWFGKPLWKKRMWGVEFSLGSIPAGGFVSLPQLAPMDVIEGKTDLDRETLPPVSVLDKIIVALAGPLFSFGLALVFAWLVWIVGRPVSESDATTVVGYVEKGSPAEKAGLLPGDKIVRVDDWAVDRFSGMGNSAITWRIVRSEGTTIPVDVLRDGAPLHFDVTPIKEEREFFQRPSLRQIGIAPALTPVVAQIIPNSPAARAGIAVNDEVIAVDGQHLYYTETLSDYLKAHPGPVRLTIERAGRASDLTVTPELPEGGTEPRIGLVWDSSGKMQLVHPRPLEQIRAALGTMFNTISAIASPKSDIKAQHLSGPVGIMRVIYLLFGSEHGWRLVIWFGVVININLALLNLLPIPVLDGGHVLLAVIEGIRGRPISFRILEVLNAGCTLVVLGFILYVSFFDVQDLPFPWGHHEAKTELKFAPKPSQP